MNIDKESSQEIAALLQEASALCNKSLMVVKENEALGIVKVYGQLAGNFMGQAFVNVLAPIWHAYPELKPQEMNEPYVEPAPTLDPKSQAAISEFLSHTSQALSRIHMLFEAQPRPVELQFDGMFEVAQAAADIENFLAQPRFRDEAPARANDV
jgi:hypothetical protein